ncbi:MAG: FAD-dependent monooxygenase [Granulosicoccus sp.]
MQYHLDGYETGDPSVAAASAAASVNTQNVDVLIVGCGPAGLTLATQLSVFPDLSLKIVERKSGPLEVGQADGIACRSVEMFEAFDMAEKVCKEAYWVNEVAFWRPEPDGPGLYRADLVQDVEDDLSEMPHVILNQARVHDFYLQKMYNSAHRLTPDYNRELVSIERTTDCEYPLTATLRRLDLTDKTELVHARYVVGCDGARSHVRQSMGLKLHGESARQLWGVMDILAVTDFPDIRKKVAVQSKDQGSLLIIPREGGYMVRMYIELGELHATERAGDRGVTSDMLAKKARAILSPFTLEIKQVPWWSAYEIGQRVCDTFDNAPDNHREPNSPDIFIAGDACHTHSPKAGQGMNVGMADAFNLGWKLAAVLRSQAKPALLNTYSIERQAKARELIEFDKDMARLFSARPTNNSEVKQFQRYFSKHGRYTAGVETRYECSTITQTAEYQHLATGLQTGMRFHSEAVTRLSDARRMQLGHTMKADGRWRLIIFAGSTDKGHPGHPVADLCNFLDQNLESPVRRFTPKNTDVDSVFDIRAVFQMHHHEHTLETMPAILLPAKGVYQLIDYEKIFCASNNDSSDIFDTRGVDRVAGALVIVRPDQYVSSVLPLTDFDALSAFFIRFMLEPAEAD